MKTKKSETKISLDKDELFDLLYNKKLSMAKISKLKNISETTLRKYLKRYKLDKKTYYKIKVDNVLTKEFLSREYVQKLKTIKEISEDTKIPSSYVFKQIKTLGLKKNKIDQNAKAMEKRKNKLLEKYNVTNVFQLEAIKEKTKQTNLKKYNAEHWSQNQKKYKEIKDHWINTLGVDHPNKLKENKNKISNTLKKKNWNIINKNRKKSNIKKYGVEHTSELETVKNKITNSMVANWGVKYPIQNKNLKKKILSTKKERGQVIIIDNMTLNEISEKYGISLNVLYKNLNFNSTKEELKIFLDNYFNNKSYLEIIAEKNLNLKFYNKKILNYRPDFKLSESAYLNFDGLYWHSELIQADKYYHFNMRKEYEDAGLRIFQFREDEVNIKFPIIQSMLNNFLNLSKNKIFARKCSIRHVDQKKANIFLNKSHIMGSIKAKHIGLYYFDELISILSYKKYKNILKIERFCSKLNYVCIGGLSKLIKFLERNIDDIEIIQSWVDLRYGNGKSLEKINFTKEKETLGWKWADLNSKPKRTYNRLFCKANMDERRLSEKEHAKEMNLVKIYDAGQRLYTRRILWK